MDRTHILSNIPTRIGRFGWGRAAIFPGLLVLVAVFPAQALESGLFVANNLVLMTPVIVMAVILSAAIQASGAGGLLAEVFNGRPLAMLLLAAGFGTITPICGIGVVPIIAGLLSAGVPLAPIMAFWLSSPITSPPMLMVTAGALGLEFAVAKTVIAFAIGLIGGIATQWALIGGAFRSPLKPGGAWSTERCASNTVAGPPLWRFWRDLERRRIFRDEAKGSTLLMVKWLTIAFAAESLLIKVLPPTLIATYVGADNTWAIPLAVTIGAPIYLDGYAALPLVRGLIDLGMTPGAAMAFLVAGGITSAYASIAVFALVSWPVFLWYLALAVLGSAAGGYAFQFLGWF